MRVDYHRFINVALADLGKDLKKCRLKNTNHLGGNIGTGVALRTNHVEHCPNSNGISCDRDVLHRPIIQRGKQETNPYIYNTQLHVGWWCVEFKAEGFEIL